ncbi:hypothetical protein Cgig2_008899 [Carnegiea gigantea]|uniref:Uncharacterized protein n=1 Tax=Carnegiea gigantea TaxID=171969 RepID=A0A9Q1KLH7_9CARY|nr:hypothetical protein Cgig2_008899 [Carnegiea gigantea]
MGFPHSLTTDEMALYILGNFKWYRREVAFPPGPLPYHYEELCPDFDLAVAKEYAQHFEVVFLVMLLNDAIKLGVLPEWMIAIIESALKELRWNAFQARMGRNRGRIKEARRQKAHGDSEEEKSSRSDSQTSLHSDNTFRLAFLTMAFPPFQATEEVPYHVRETFQWHWRSASRPLRPLPKDNRELCPRFALSKAEEAAHDFGCKGQVAKAEWHNEWRRLNIPLALGFPTSCWLKDPPKDGPSTNASSNGTSASSSSQGAPNAPGRAVLRKRRRTPVELVLEVVAEELVFPGAPSRSDPVDGPSTHSPNPKVTPSLKRTTLKKSIFCPWDIVS